MIPAEFGPIANHLWQSTLFAVAAALLTLALRRNSARVRYALWLAASYKFLIPFSWLVSFGHLLEWRSAPPLVPPAIATVMNVVGAPVFLMPPASVGATPQHSSLLPAAIWCIWACGFLVLTAGWARQWWQIRRMVKRGTRLDLGLAIPVVSVSSQLEPGVFGISRPVLLLPERIGKRLAPEQLRAVIAHELFHVRRRDNLAAAIHMLVEALFWFHPLVWWLDRRIVDERERSCDEQVLRMGGDPAVYVETILTVCKSYVAAPRACMSGISGADLKRRVVRIMSRDLTDKLTLARRAMLWAVGTAAVAGPLALGVMNAPLLGAQNATVDWEKAAGGKMKFEVASVKENNSPPSADTVHFNVPITTWDFPVGAPTGGLYSATNLPVAVYLGFAYKIQGYALDDLERQLQSAGFSAKRYDIEARGAGNPTRDQYRLMMQSLLADRFKLAFHWGTKQMLVMALVLDKPGKLGHQLRAHVDVPPCPDSPDVVLPQTVPSAAGGFPLDCGVIAHDRKNVATGNTRYFARNVSMASLATTLSYTSTSRDSGKPVVDETGLTGNYDFIFEFTPDNSNQPQPDAISLTGALKDDLGLKLEPATAPVEVPILDHIEEPSPN
jgi:bla regulator protein BlaR1